MSEAVPAVEVRELTKRYGTPESGVLAVDRISFQVHRGEVFGFLGPNGAGKTTTIRMLAGLSEPTAGAVRMLGLERSRDLSKIKKRIGVVPEASNLYNELTAFDNLIFSMQLYGVSRQRRAPRAEELLARFQLSDKRDTPFKKLSRGMKRALTIAAALAHEPALLFLDEPTTGLDVISARNLRQLIAGLRQEGVTVFLTTHYLEEADRLCDRIALLVRGQIVALDTVAGLKARVREATAVEVVMQKGDRPTVTRRFVGDDTASLVREALAHAESEEQQVLAVQTVRPSLEDVFVELTGLSVEKMKIDRERRGK